MISLTHVLFADFQVHRLPVTQCLVLVMDPGVAVDLWMDLHHGRLPQIFQQIFLQRRFSLARPAAEAVGHTF